MKLSVIIPFCVEYPQNAFTVQALWNELRDLKDYGHDFEIIVVDNWCEQASKQIKAREPIPGANTIKEFLSDVGWKVKGALRIHPELMGPYMEQLDKLRNLAETPRPIYRTQDRGSQYLAGIAEGRSWLKYCQYIQRLSHWQAKNAGVALATGEVLLFVDAHVVPSKNSIVNAFRYYADHWEAIHGTLHLPLAYLLEKDSGRLIYKFVGHPDDGQYHYSFTGYREPSGNTRYYPVDCMSTCGMFMHKSIFNALGGWPEELGIYGGGEHFINFTLAVLGYSVNIFRSMPLYHFAEHRGYNYEYDDFVRNKILATYIFGGHSVAQKFINHLVKTGKGRQSVVERMLADVEQKCSSHRDKIKKNQVYDIETWYYQHRPGRKDNE